MFEPEVIVKRIVLVVGILALVLVVFVAKFQNLADVNAADYAQAARHLARGEGFTTSVVTPLSLRTVPRLDHHPELTRPPLHTCVVALCILIGGANDRAVAMGSVVFYLLTLLLVYLIARRAFGDQIGVFAVLISLFSVPLLEQAIAGLEVSLLTFLVTLVLGLMLWWEVSGRPDGWRWPVAAGIVLGLGYLTRYEAISFLVLVIVYWLLADRRRAARRILLTVACFAVVVAPWVIRSSLIVGRPFISLRSYELVMMTDFSPMQTVLRGFEQAPMPPMLEAIQYPGAMVRKINRGLGGLYETIAGLGAPYVMPFFVVGLVLGSIRRRYALFQWLLAGGFLLHALVLSLYMPIPRLLLPFAPIVGILAAAWFAALVDDYVHSRLTSEPDVFARRIRPLGQLTVVGPELLGARLRYLALSVWLLVVCYPTVSFLFGTAAAREHPVVEICRALGRENTRLVATDIPWMVAWYADRTAMLLPQNERELAALDRSRIRADAIYLSPALMNMPATEGMQFWQSLGVSGRDFEGYVRDRQWKHAGGLWKRAG